MTVQEPPEEPRTELVDKLLAGAFSSLPVAGGAAGAWYQYLMEGPYNRRLAEWRASITDVVNELVMKVDRLLENEVFLDAFIQSTRIAQTTHQQAKLAALRNALVNSVAPDAPEVDEQARFFRLVDEFSARHILLLRWAAQYRLSDPGAPLPAFAGSGDFRGLMVDDLVRSHLIGTRPSSSEVLVGDLFDGLVTDLGRQFLKFISEGDNTIRRSGR